MIQKALLISFDIIREGECEKSYSIASLLAYIKSVANNHFEISHQSFNVQDNGFEPELFEWIDKTNFNEFTSIAISNYVWSEYIIGEVLSKIDKKFKGVLILGGNQVTYSNELPKEYPECSVFITGFGESALYEAINFKSSPIVPKIIQGKNLLKQYPSPYLSGELTISDNQRMVRMESKRGCIFSCNFCAHRELYRKRSTKVFEFPTQRVYSELDLFKKHNVQKINFIDPIFNYGDNYIEILQYILKSGINSKISLQTKFELIKGKKGEQFLDICEKVNVILEFGLQTVFEEEYKAIKRSNKLKLVTEILTKLNKRNIDYEVNIIYGLPKQTINSFKESIAFLKNLNCKKIVAHPLMLLKGTELYQNRNLLNLKDEILINSHYPIVTESDSFTKKEWIEMESIANNLN